MLLILSGPTSVTVARHAHVLDARVVVLVDEVGADQHQSGSADADLLEALAPQGALELAAGFLTHRVSSLVVGVSGLGGHGLAADETHDVAHDVVELEVLRRVHGGDAEGFELYLIFGRDDAADDDGNVAQAFLA